MLADNGIFIAKAKKWAISATVQKKARHFVLVKISAANVALIILVVVIVCAELARALHLFAFTHNNFPLRKSKNFLNLLLLGPHFEPTDLWSLRFTTTGSITIRFVSFLPLAPLTLSLATCGCSKKFAVFGFALAIFGLLGLDGALALLVHPCNRLCYRLEVKLNRLDSVFADPCHIGNVVL